MDLCPNCGTRTIRHCNSDYCVADWCPRAACGWESDIACTIRPPDPTIWDLEQRVDGGPKRQFKPVTIVGRIVSDWLGGHRPIGWAFDWEHPAPEWPESELLALCGMEEGIDAFPVTSPSDRR